MAFRSPVGQELEIVQVHVAVEPFVAALKAVHADKADEVEVVDFAGRDEALAHLCYACAAMLSGRTPGSSRRVADLTRLLASFLAENYTKAAAEKPSFQGGLPIQKLRKVEDFLLRCSGGWWGSRQPSSATPSSKSSLLFAARTRQAAQDRKGRGVAGARGLPYASRAVEDPGVHRTTNRR